MKIAASFLGIKENVEQNILVLDQTTIDYLHVDIMDGKFVKNKTWSFKKVNNLLKETTTPKDVHLMVKNVKKYIKKFKDMKPEYITFHFEACKNCFELIKIIKKCGIKAGISIKLDTSIDSIKPYLPYLDLVLVMSVEPGMGGQEFIDSSLEKIKGLDKIRKENNYQYLIEVDGGINDSNISHLKEFDVDIAVVGSFITGKDDYQKQINKLKK